MEPVKIIIVDDHKIIRDGLIAILMDNPFVNIAGSVNSGDELFELLKSQAVDLILLDMHMPVKGGIEIAAEVKAKYPQLKILMNTMSEIPKEIEAAIAANVDGYILKTSGSDELLNAIHRVAHGSSYYSPPVVTSYIKNMNIPPGADTGLTPLQLEIIKMIYNEKKTAEILEELKISKQLLCENVQSMYVKLNVNTEMGLIKYALQKKLIG